MSRLLVVFKALLIIVLVTAALPGLAQDGGSIVATDDQVNAIAQKLYCPVCENITLDTCGTAACADWRYEIRLQLEAGRTEQQIIDDFVVRFGDRVVGTPQDPTLRTLSLVAPWVLIGLGLVTALVVMVRMRRGRDVAMSAPTAGGDRYRDMLERDLAN
jgi:cytochrome c-type biogenesis protein CcmH